MITLDSASGYLEIPKIYDYQLLMENIKIILNIDDELFKYLYFSYYDPKEQERIRLNPQIFDDFISYDSPTLSIGFLENVDENIMNQFIEIIDLNKKRFKEMGYKVSEEDLSLNKDIIVNDEIILEKENEIEIKKDENNINLEKEKEIEIKNDKNNINPQQDNKIEIKKDDYNIILEKEKEIEIRKDEDINLDKENKIQIGKDNNNNSDKDIKSQMRKDDDIILEKENININNIDLNNNQIKEKISDNFNLLDSDNIKKININSDIFLNYQSNNSIKKIDSNILRNIDSSEINLIKFDKNNSNSLIFEENKEIEEDEFNKNIENIISSNIDNIKDDIIHSILLESSKIQQKTKINKTNPKNNYIHKNYECDVCKIHPIKGIRYHCLECKDFDLCEKCEEKVNHEHPLYKIKNEKLCKFKN